MMVCVYLRMDLSNLGAGTYIVMRSRSRSGYLESRGRRQKPLYTLRRLERSVAVTSHMSP